MSRVEAPAPAGRPTIVALAAVVLAALAVVLLVLATAGLGGAGAGFVLSLLGFVLALTARLRHQRWRPLWLPLALFPVVVITAAFWV